MKRCLVLAEGQTEEQFVKLVLRAHLLPLGIDVIPTIVNTKRVKDGPNFKGGISSYKHFARDLRRLVRDTAARCVTTLIDYYGLPADFPGMSSRPHGTPLQRVLHVERELAVAIGDPRFKPYAALHEYETLIFSDLAACSWVFSDGVDLTPLILARSCVSSPEDINDGPDTAPSKRILGCDPAYQKPLQGPMAVEAVGLAKARAECPHFNDWVTHLENL